MRSEKAGLYIHVPFCLSKCAYCDFYSVKTLHLIPDYIAAVQKEMKLYRNIFSSFDSIYIGGGTPSLLAPQYLDEIFTALNKYFIIDKNAEITLEANPGDLSPVYLKALRDTGINRLNIGVQSFNDKILKCLGRRHSAQEAMASINAARKAGFRNLGIDLIYGIYGLGFQGWKKILQQALILAPEHLSCYQLSLHEKTPLHKTYLSAGWHLPDDNAELKFFLTTSEILENVGYRHYEVSNFARKDKYTSRHNQKYWQHVPYLGLGPAANSFLNNQRWWNKASVKRYLNAMARGKTPVEASETLTVNQLRLEALFLGLRCKSGIDLKRFKDQYGTDLMTEKKSIMDALMKNKLIELKNGFLCPTRSGMALADSLALI